jgi:hypothetical protein
MIIPALFLTTMVDMDQDMDMVAMAMVVMDITPIFIHHLIHLIHVIHIVVYQQHQHQLPLYNCLT